jgi:Lysozyme like domain
VASVLSTWSLQGLWTQANGNPIYTDVMVAIAQAESGGDPTDINSSDPHGGSFGLWQINGANADGGAVAAGAQPTYQGQSLFDPLTNAQAAAAIFASQGFGAWEGSIETWWPQLNSFQQWLVCNHSPGLSKCSGDASGGSGSTNGSGGTPGDISKYFAPGAQGFANGETVTVVVIIIAIMLLLIAMKEAKGA